MLHVLYFFPAKQYGVQTEITSTISRIASYTHDEIISPAFHISVYFNLSGVYFDRHYTTLRKQIMGIYLIQV